MKIKLVKYHPLFAYSVGDVFEVNKKDTEYLLGSAYAVEASKNDAEKAEEEEFARLEAEEAKAKIETASEKIKPETASIKKK